MQAVILAAGRGTRMKELTEGTPKALLKVTGKSLLEHKLDILPDKIDEVIIVVGYMGSMIHDYLGGTYNGKRLLYEEQEVFDGTAGALWEAKDALSDKFLVMMGDDLYSREDIERCLMPPDGWVQLVQESNEPRTGGNVELDKDHHIVAITEGEHRDKGYIGTNLYVLDTRIFNFPKIPKSKGSQEYGLPQTAIEAAKRLNIPFYAVKATSWVQISTPEDLKKAEDFFGA